jgi:hypothetical protein
VYIKCFRVPLVKEERTAVDPVKSSDR